MKKYEYNQVYLSFKDDGTNHLSYLNANGINGWELVSAMKVDDYNVCYIFKREILHNEKILLAEEKK